MEGKIKTSMQSTVMVLSFRTDRTRQAVDPNLGGAVSSGSTLLRIPVLTFDQ